MRNLSLIINAFLQNFTIDGFNTINKNYITHPILPKSEPGFLLKHQHHIWLYCLWPLINTSGLKPPSRQLTSRYTYVILNKQFNHILKPFLPHLKIFKYFTRSITQIWHFFALFSLLHAQYINFLPVVINSTYWHHKRVPIVLLVNYCLLLTEENSALHSYFFLLRMFNTRIRYLSHNASCRYDDTSVKNVWFSCLRAHTHVIFADTSAVFIAMAWWEVARPCEQNYKNYTNLEQRIS